MLATKTGIHNTTVQVEQDTGNPVITAWDSISFIYTGDDVTAKNYYLNGNLVRTDTYSYTDGKLIGITKEIV